MNESHVTHEYIWFFFVCFFFNEYLGALFQTYKRELHVSTPYEFLL